MRNPNIDTTTPEKEEGVSNPRRDRELERPQGPGETGPEMIPPGRVRTGKGGGDTGAGKGDDAPDDDERDDDDGDIPATDQETGRYNQQPANSPTTDDAERGNRNPTRSTDDTERGGKGNARGTDGTDRGNRNPRQ